MDSKPVFFDPKGRRKRRTTSTVVVVGLLIGFIMTLFMISLLAIPILPRVPAISSPTYDGGNTGLLRIKNKKSKLSRLLLKFSHADLFKEISRDKKRSKAAMRAQEDVANPGNNIVVGFYAPWQETGIQSLHANANKLTHVAPEWLHLKPTGDELDFTDWDLSVTPGNKEIIKTAREHHLKVTPILNNAEGGQFDPERVHKLLTSPQNQVTLASSIRDWLLKQKFQGVNVDLENLYPGDYAKLPQFLDILSQTLHRSGFVMSVDAETDNDNVPLAAYAKYSDFVVLMAYDEHSEDDPPGPIASIQWYERILKNALLHIPADKLVIGIGNYAYDWTENKTPAQSTTYQSALALAADNNPGDKPENIVSFDGNSLNSTFKYDDDQNRRHQVWVLDAASAYNQWLLASRQKVHGAALWVLGSEDPSIWTFLDKRAMNRSPNSDKLRKVHYPYEVEFDGEGEILSVHSTPHEGERKLTIDNDTGILVDEEYKKFPSSYVIYRSGYKKKDIALTFDDGPSGKFTPQILDELKKQGIHATFFVIGENAQQYPGLICRLWDEGHEIGNHTYTHPNIGVVSRRRAELELNTTQITLESIIQRSTVLFRPPYNADAEPISGEEVRPLIIASKLGYVTVGEFIDPQDWNLYDTTTKGMQVRRSAQEIAGSIIEGIEGGHGNVVLLHDGGGDRSHTVEALRMVVPKLRAKGYRFVTVSQLLNLPRNKVMPPINKKDAMLIGFDRVMFNSISGFRNFLSLAFILGIVLGIGRIIFITALAAAARRRDHVLPEAIRYRPPVSVLIAAHNEQPVIARTITSILKSLYKPLEVIVVDDGSEDGTAREVKKSFKDNPNIKVIRQKNLGKATALNNAIKEATGEILVCLDADTQIAPDAIHLLARHFADPRIATVAGNIKVGNRINLITYWQSIEYITSQNLDRRAFALLNAITVIPGAIGAWRKSAVVEVGGYLTDTLAEDMDLTWRLRRKGWLLDIESKALAYTEAPDNLRALFRQRFRWAYGTLQCLWKHKDALFRHGWFGWAALPSLWIFQVFFQMLAPLVDFIVLYNIFSVGLAWVSWIFSHGDYEQLAMAMLNLEQVGFFYALFFVVELFAATVAFRIDKEKLKPLWLLFWQRFAYRQLMYVVIWKSIWTAAKGIAQSWHKVDRKGTVDVVTF